MALATAEVGIPRPPVVGANPRPVIAVWRIVAARFLVGAVVGPARVRREYPAGQVLVVMPLLLIGVSLLGRAIASRREVGPLTEALLPRRTARRRPDLRPGLPLRRELCTSGKLPVLGDPPATRSEPRIRREARIPRELAVRSPLRTGRSRWYRAKFAVRSRRSARRSRARRRNRWQRTRGRAPGQRTRAVRGPGAADHRSRAPVLPDHLVLTDRLVLPDPAVLPIPLCCLIPLCWLIPLCCLIALCCLIPL